MTLLVRLMLLGVALTAKTATADQPSLNSLEQAYQKLVNSRAIHIAHLQEYAAAGQFPLNTDFPDRMTPYFVDDIGTACAVGHLLRRDGQEALVAKVAATTNHIRIDDVRAGPLLEWIRQSGLTKAECALIQPSYAQIKDYRRGRSWRDEIARLQEHFVKVEQRLLTHTERSLREGLLAKVDIEIALRPNNPAVGIQALSKALTSENPTVRIAAVYVLGKQAKLHRGARLKALEPHLADPDLAVRFWTAQAMEQVGAASPRGRQEIHLRTLPCFLETFYQGEQELRLPALNQLANTAPMTMGTGRQFRIMPEIRRTLTSACEDQDPEVRDFARRVLASWRWQRCVYESQRIRRQYLAASADLEALATETLALGRGFAEWPPRAEILLELRSIYDHPSSMIHLSTASHGGPVSVAKDDEEAKQFVEDYCLRTYKKYRGQTKAKWPFWRIVSVNTDRRDQCFVVKVQRPEATPLPEAYYIVPQPSMLTSASLHPHSWLGQGKQIPWYGGPTPPGRSLQPKEGLRIMLGEASRDDLQEFTSTCDFLASFMTYYALVILDREAIESTDTLTWSARFAYRRQNNPRFFGEGVGSSSIGEGTWDFHRVRFQCDRATGCLTLSAAPIEYPNDPIPPEVLSPAWMTREYKWMGWKPLEALDYFADELLPPEYHEGVAMFASGDTNKARRIIFSRHRCERNLPRSGFILGLLYEQAGQREAAVRAMNQAARGYRHDPRKLVEVARWKLSVQRYDDARKHAEAALALWPESPDAREVLRQLKDGATLHE